MFGHELIPLPIHFQMQLALGLAAIAFVAAVAVLGLRRSPWVYLEAGAWCAGATLVVFTLAAALLGLDVNY